jgi:hypothetical protein
LRREDAEVADQLDDRRRFIVGKRRKTSNLKRQSGKEGQVGAMTISTTTFDMMAFYLLALGITAFDITTHKPSFRRGAKLHASTSYYLVILS